MKDENQDVLDYVITEDEVNKEEGKEENILKKPVEKIGDSILDSLTRPIGTSFVDTIIKGV